MAFVWQISVVHYGEISIASGVILEGSPKKESDRVTKNFRRVLGSYFKKPFSNKQILLYLGNDKVKGLTDEHGGFLIESNQILHGDIKVYDAGQISPLEIPQSYPVFFDDSLKQLAVISDVDDTILVSHTASLWKRVNTLLFVKPNKRQPISFTKQILEKAKSRDCRIFYVSKSESNLFGLLTSFIKHHNIPEGVLNLTSYLKLKQLLHPKKGKDYKERSICSIIDLSPGKKFILMGDDTQLDMAVYSRIAEIYPDRILKIYIRKTQKNLLGNKKEQLNILMTNDVPFMYFSDEDNVEEEIKMINKY